MDFLAMLREVGFDAAELSGETGFNSSSNTKGVLIRAVRPAIDAAASRMTLPDDPLALYREFSDQVYSRGVLDRKIKYLIALGTSLGAGCEP